MANIDQQINNVREAAALGKNPLVSQLAAKRVYDEAVRNLDAKDRRPKVTFARQLNTEHMRIVSDAYPEFTINFSNSVNSVHSLAGGLRALELEYMMMQIPFGSPCYDIGGNFTSHLLKGRSYIHCCNPCLDLKDAARNVMYHDSIQRYVNKFSRPRAQSPPEPSTTPFAGYAGRVLPDFQVKAIERYHTEPHSVSCTEVFQACPYTFPQSGETYAVSLHSIYDIPFAEIGPALLRKGTKVLFAAFHFSEELLIGADKGEMNEIGAFFIKDGDNISFRFGNESTLHYEHSFENIRKIVTRTYFPASDRVVYVKEFMVKRVNTFFFRLVKVDTHVLHKSLMEYPSAGTKNEYFSLNSSPIFKDKATFSVWFPSAAKSVVIPVFKRKSFFSGSVSVSQMLVESDFAYTVYNHICTYDNKALTWKNVQSFVESIRSRVVVNGVSVRSEWNVPIDQLTDISFTLFLMVKLKKSEVEFLESKIDTGSKSLFQALCDSVSSAVDGLKDHIVDALSATGWFSSHRDELVFKAPCLFMDFSDYLSGVFEADAQVEKARVGDALASSDSLYKKISELCDKYTGLDFDTEKFQHFCEKFDVSPELITHVIEGIFSLDAGVTVAGDRGLAPPIAAAIALSPIDADTCEDLMDEGEDSDISLIANCSNFSCEELRRDVLVEKAALQPFYRARNSMMVNYMVNNSPTKPKQWVEKGSITLPQMGLSVRKNFHKVDFSDDEKVALSAIHLKPVDDLRLKESITPVLYTGPIRVRQMNNYLDYLSSSLGAVINNLRRLVLATWESEGETMLNYGLFDCSKRSWVLVPNDKAHQWGIVLTDDKVVRVVLLQYDDDGLPVVEKNWVRFAVSSDTKIFSVIRSLEVLSKEPVKDVTAEVTLVDGVPGCGKTAEIVSKVNWQTDLVLTPGKEAAAMIRRRANSKFRKPVATHDNVRTFDSFIMNKKPYKFTTLWVDEGLMVHTGLLNFSINIAGVKKVFVFGDRKQIPFINRVMNFDYPVELSKLIVDNVERRDVTKRCPVDVTKFLNEVYPNAVSTTSDVFYSLNAKRVAGPGLLRPELTAFKGKIVTFTQSDKFTLEKAGYTDVNTVHEIQGETFDEVSLVRATATPIGLITRKSPHVLVALTRHTKTLTYYTVTVDCICTIVDELNGVDQSILSMYQCVAGKA
ncbi:130 kDa replicase [Cucumber mottle virus]|nr:130 kDa replicase [Cucumber mottle virus]BAF37645.1 130 kDa replicase [Cucumber mottle virus]